MINEKPVHRTIIQNSPVFPTLFDVTLPKGVNRKINPWVVQKCVWQGSAQLPW